MTTKSRLTAAAILLGTLGATGLAVADTGFSHGGPGMAREIDFTMIDTNGDGLLSRDELITRATERFADADTSADGSLDRAEIAAQMPEPRNGFGNIFGVDRAQQRADRILAMVGATEAGQAPIAALADQRVNMLLSFADEDRDAAISEAEAAALPTGLMSGHGRHSSSDGGKGQMQRGRMTDDERGMRGGDGPRGQMRSAMQNKDGACQMRGGGNGQQGWN